MASHVKIVFTTVRAVNSSMCGHRALLTSNLTGRRKRGYARKGSHRAATPHDVAILLRHLRGVIECKLAIDLRCLLKIKYHIVFFGCLKLRIFRISRRSRVTDPYGVHTSGYA